MMLVISRARWQLGVLRVGVNEFVRHVYFNKLTKAQAALCLQCIRQQGRKPRACQVSSAPGVWESTDAQETEGSGSTVSSEDQTSGQEAQDMPGIVNAIRPVAVKKFNHFDERLRQHCVFCKSDNWAGSPGRARYHQCHAGCASTLVR